MKNNNQVMGIKKVNLDLEEKSLWRPLSREKDELKKNGLVKDWPSFVWFLFQRHKKLEEVENKHA